MATQYQDAPEIKEACKSATALEAIPCGRFVTLDNGGVRLAQPGDHVIGISQTEATAAGQQVSFGGVNAVLPVEAGAALNEGDSVTAGTDGVAVAATIGDLAPGQVFCSSAAAAGEFVSVLFVPGTAA